MIDEIPLRREAFGVTSSLEEALYQAAVEEGSGQQMTTEGTESENPTRPQDLFHQDITPSKLRVAQTSGSPSPDIRTPSSIARNKNSQERFHEVETSSPSKRDKVITAEEHNALLLADPKVRNSSTANPDFLKQFYSESRLHHLSTWKAELKSRFQKMAAQKSASQKPPAKRKPGSRRYIMHVDFDSFFCAVSLKSAPEYVDKPAVVAHGTGTGSEIASCNYPARAFGVKNGTWMKQALKLCPDIKVLPYDFPAYEEASGIFYEAIIGIGGIVQSVSIDEALVDITSLCLAAGGSDGLGIQEGSLWREQEKADEIADSLRRLIKEKTGCAVSVGIGGNILLAKVALRKAKPAGQHQIKPEDVLDFLGELQVMELPGVAYSIGGKLEEIGVKTVKDIRQFTKERLMTVLGPKTGEKLWDYSRGIDRAEVGEQVVRKSVSAEVNWGIRFISQSEAEEFVRHLCVELQRRLVEQKVKGRQLTMKIMKKAADAPLDPPKHLGHGMCDTYNKSIIFGVATNSAEMMGHEAVSILRSYGFSPGELRGLGVQMTKLEPFRTSDTLPDGSQRRINFGKLAAPKPMKHSTEDPIDDPETPKRTRTTPTAASTKRTKDPIADSLTPQESKPSSTYLLGSDDPIDDIDSPKKAKSTPVHPAARIARANAADSSAKKFLNLAGTQFIMPTQVDPSVLAELPQDIRSKLVPQSIRSSTSRDQSPALKSRSSSPKRHLPKPLPSQFDPEVFAALPSDMKAELLASHSSHAAKNSAQSLLPQSPPKPRPIPPKKTTPIKRRGRPPGSRNKKDDPYQSNFVRDPSFHNSKEPSPDADSDLDADFLSALPEDMRLEIIAEHARKQKTKSSRCGGLSLVKKRRPPEAPPPQTAQRKLRLPPREPKPTFTTQELSALPQLRETLSAWFAEFADDGPHPDDVAAMERYLRRVVLEERDLGKVVSVVRWIGWLVDEGEGEGTEVWRRALEGIKEKVQDAVQERGLGRLEL